MTLRVGVLLVTIVGLWSAQPIARAEVDAAALTEGVKTIAAPGTPGTLAVWSSDAAILAVGKDGDLDVPVVGAGEFGRGRMVAFTHTGHLDAGSLAVGDHRKLLENVANWAAGQAGRRPSRVGLLNCKLDAFFGEIGFEVVDLDRSWHTQPLHNRIDLLCIVGNALNDEQVRAIERFISGGGGVLAAQTAWAWSPKEGATLRENPLNRIVAGTGIAWTGAYADKNAAGTFDAAGETRLLNAASAIEALQSADASKLDPQQRKLAAASATSAARLLPADDLLLRPKLAKLLAEQAARLVPTPKTPIGQDRPFDRFLLAFQLSELESAPAAKVTAHPAAAAFPGEVPEGAQRVQRAVEIDTATPDWHSTGLYAAPGEVISVDVPMDAADLNLRVRIGCHQDQLWHLNRWQRAPDITIEKPLAGGRSRIASAFGGPVYIVVPGKAAARKVTVRISGAVEAPMFVLGKTSRQEWASRLHGHPAPWAELVTSKVILSVPSESIRSLEDPEELLRLWDRVLDAAADLAAIPRDRRRPERYVPDEQISAGYMHSGYPIMTHLDAVPDMTQASRLAKGCWGLFHELGHNHQEREWTFAGTGEVTCNLFSLYICETVCGLPVSTGHDALKNPEETIGKHLALGAKFDRWKSEPFVALMMYIQLREAFGWEAYKKVFAEYQSLPATERPKGDEESRDQWMVRFSRTVNRNLGPFFQAWGIPTSEQARASIANLPPWMPEGFPPD